MTSIRRLAGFALVTTLLLGARDASAQRSAADIESARELYNQGLELRDRGDLRGALEKFRAAHALGNTPITGTDLCKTYAALKQPVEARETCLSVGRIPVSGNESARAQQSRADAVRIAEAEKPKIASVRVALSGVPQGREPTVTIDGTTIPAAALSQYRAVNPGTHELSARVGGGAESRAAIELREGESKEVTLIVQAPPADAAPVTIMPPAATPAPAPAPAPERRGRSALTTTGFLLAGGGVIIGTISALVAQSNKDELAEKCLDNVCGRSEHGTLDRANAWANVSTVAFVVGGIGVGLGVVGLVTDARRPSSAGIKPLVGLGSVGVRGAF